MKLKAKFKVVGQPTNQRPNEVKLATPNEISIHIFFENLLTLSLVNLHFHPVLKWRGGISGFAGGESGFRELNHSWHFLLSTFSLSVVSFLETYMFTSNGIWSLWWKSRSRIQPLTDSSVKSWLKGVLRADINWEMWGLLCMRRPFFLLPKWRKSEPQWAVEKIVAQWTESRRHNPAATEWDGWKYFGEEIL